MRIAYNAGYRQSYKFTKYEKQSKHKNIFKRRPRNICIIP